MTNLNENESDVQRAARELRDLQTADRSQLTPLECRERDARIGQLQAIVANDGAVQQSPLWSNIDPVELSADLLKVLAKLRRHLVTGQIAEAMDLLPAIGIAATVLNERLAGKRASEDAIRAMLAGDAS